MSIGIFFKTRIGGWVYYGIKPLFTEHVQIVAAYSVSICNGINPIVAVFVITIYLKYTCTIYFHREKEIETE